MKKWIQTVYRKFQSKIIKKGFLPLFFSKGRDFKLPEGKGRPFLKGSQRIWFHAASVGELESLWTLIEAFAKQGYSLVLTVLSESAENSLERLSQSLRSQKAVLLYHGFSPWEGEWEEALQFFQPSLFVTAKYEAWPDLWMSLKGQQIPLAIVGARARKSLKIARNICQFLVGGPPTLYLFPCLETEVAELKVLFPQAVIQALGEPRWDRVMARLKAGNERAKELIQTYQDLERPWAVVGSAWLEDLAFIQPLYQKFSGTLWVVPHQVHSDPIHKMESFLKGQGYQVLKSSEFRNPLRMQKSNSSESRSCILIDEMGFLSEIYSAADWVFVGGGFGAGIHSTIEPAIQGIPLGIGPRGAEKFSEVSELSRSGQLTILTDSEQLLVWYDSLARQSEKKLIWLEDVQRRLGATARIFSVLEAVLIQ